MKRYHFTYSLMVIFYLVLSGKVSAGKQVSSVQSAMKANAVVPDMISVEPDGPLKVVYPSGAKVEQGNELTPTVVKDEPTVTYDGDLGGLYTLSMSDPDAPSRKNPIAREWQHWLVVNIPGGDVSQGEVINEYVGSGPPPETGLHRYVFLVYKQPSRLTVTEPRHTKFSGKLRPKFRIKDFAEKYGLGNPIAGNFYQAKWDDYVPHLYEQLKD